MGGRVHHNMETNGEMRKEIEELSLRTSAIRATLKMLNETQQAPAAIAEILLGIGILAEEADDRAAKLWEDEAWSDLSGDPVEEDLPETLGPVTDAPEAPVEVEMIASGEIPVFGRKFPYPGTPEAKAAVERVRIRNKEMEASGNHLMSGNSVVKRRSCKKKEDNE